MLQLETMVVEVLVGAGSSRYIVVVEVVAILIVVVWMVVVAGVQMWRPWWL